MMTKTTLIVNPADPENIQVSLVRRQFTNASRVLAKFWHRTECDSDLLLLEYDVEEEHHEWVSEVSVGCEQDGPVIQDIGSIITKEACPITFLYVLQHHVLPFQHLDKSKVRPWRFFLCTYT
jgi:hypothetical protein